MKKYLIGIVLVIESLAYANFLNAQSINDLRINEVMLSNTSSYIDNYGQREAWIELVNLGYNKVNIANCYLTNDLNDPKMYKIPSGDPISVIPLRQFLVFFADGNTEHGTLHLNFKLDSTHRFIALISPNGKTVLDSVTVPMIPENHTYSRIPDGIGNWTVGDVTTPNATNGVFKEQITVGEKFLKVDPFGGIMAVTAMLVVFTALFILYRIFSMVGKANQNSVQRKANRSGKTAGEVPVVEEEIAGEVFAAISAALYMYETEKHDQESTIITIQRVSRLYSPWSSKIYGLRQAPNRILNQRTKR